MKQPQLSVDLAPHEQQLGKYRLVVKLGQGGMGTVYLALASGLGGFRKLLVVKELRHDLPWRESSLSMFMDEAQLAARLDHPNVLQTFEAGEADGRFFLAMEYLDGQPLSAIIDQGLPLELHVYILCEVLQGLQYAHDLTDYDGTRLHVVHRDVSPQNVFVTYHGQVKVVDFGVAKANNGSNITSPGVFKGKFAYAAPEQLLSRPVDGRCDVFAVGVMLWEAIAGRRFGVPKPTVDAFRVRTQGLEPRIAQVSADVDPLLAEICDHALAIDPLQRIESAEAFRTRLQEWLHLQGEHIQTKQLAAHMSERFSAERAERRRVIERAMIDAGASQSVIATLPRELYERESGMAAKVDPHSELSSASGISPAPIAQAHADDPASTRSTMSATSAQAQQQAAHTQGSGRLPEAHPAQVGHGKPAFRPSSVALLVCVAAAVFVATYQVSRRVTEAPTTPQLRAAQPRETSTSSALHPTAPAAHSSDALPPTMEPAPPSGAQPQTSATDVSTKHPTAGSADSAREQNPARDSLAPDTSRGVARDHSDRAAQRSASARDAFPASGEDSSRGVARDHNDRAAQRSAVARDAFPASGEDSSRAAGHDPSERAAARDALGPAEPNKALARDQNERAAQRAAAARDALGTADPNKALAHDQNERAAQRAAAARDALGTADPNKALARDQNERAAQRSAAARDALGPADPNKALAREPSERAAQRAAAARDALGTADPDKALAREPSERAGKARDVPGGDSNRAGHDPSERASRHAAAARDGLTADSSKAARVQPGGSQRTAAEVPAVPAVEVAGPNPKAKLTGVRPVTVATEPAQARARPATERTDHATTPERAPAAKTRATSSATRADPGMGSDLRQLRSNGPMRIDVEDPYQ